MFSLVSYVIGFRIASPNSNFQRKPNLTKKLIDFDSFEGNKSRWHSSFELPNLFLHRLACSIVNYVRQTETQHNF